YADVDLTDFLPYYHQSATQLGYPLDDESHLTDLLFHPNEDQAASYIPAGIPVPSYDPAVVVDVQTWVKTEANRLLLVYGERDPWRAGELELGAAADSFKL